VSPPRITLMQAEKVARPFHREGWIHEEEYDGWRMVAYKDRTARRAHALLAEGQAAKVPRGRVQLGAHEGILGVPRARVADSLPCTYSLVISVALRS